MNKPMINFPKAELKKFYQAYKRGDVKAVVNSKVSKKIMGLLTESDCWFLKHD